jgi:hypothetical protein
MCEFSLCAQHSAQPCHDHIPHPTHHTKSTIALQQLLAIDDDDELGEVDLPGFDGGRQTLLCSNTLFDTLIQVSVCVGVERSKGL